MVKKGIKNSAIPINPKNISISAPTQCSILNIIPITEIELKTAPDI